MRVLPRYMEASISNYRLSGLRAWEVYASGPLQCKVGMVRITISKMFILF